MIAVRKSEDRGHFDHGWLDSYHTFSFSDYFDPKFHGFRALRVINEDRVQPAEGFDTHPHENMEIITYVLEGELAHKDSMGNGSAIKPGEVQYMSAGTGVTHSEFNGSKTSSVHLLQIWIFPDKDGLPPRYGQKSFSDRFKPGKLTLAVSPTGEDGSIAIRQDAKLFIGHTNSTSPLSYSLTNRRFGWVQVTRGEVELNGKKLVAGDGAAVSEEDKLEFKSPKSESEFLLFDLS